MKVKFLWLWIPLLVINFSTIHAQYIRQFEFRTEHERRLKYALDDWLSFMKSKHVSAITVGTNYIYFGMQDGGILRYKLFSDYWDFPFTTSNGLPSNTVLDVAYDQETGYLWAVTDVDTCLFKPAEQEWLCKSEVKYWNYKFPQRPQPDTVESIQFNVFYPARFLQMLPNYFANGAYTITGEWTVMDEYFDEFPISGFLRDNWERIWFAIDGLGIGIGNTFSQRMDVYPFGLTDISPRVMQFQFDDLWIGGQPRNSEDFPGIVNWRNRDGGWYYYRARFISRLPSDNVTDIETLKDSVWFATDLGISLYDMRENKWKNFGEKDGLYNSQVLDLMHQGTTLYVGTIDGLNMIDLPTGVLTRAKAKAIKGATIYQLAAQEDTIWAATNRGILRYNPGQNDWVSVATTAAIQDVPTLAVEVFEDEVWFSSPEGVFWLDTKNRKWESFPQLGAEMPGPFFDLEVNNLSVWVSTSEGLLKYDREDKYWRLFTEQDGLLNNQCYRLLLDGDYIWIATESGITRFYWNSPERID